MQLFGREVIDNPKADCMEVQDMCYGQNEIDCGWEALAPIGQPEAHQGALGQNTRGLVVTSIY